MAKRGTDHTWQLVQYKGDGAIYARCKCGYRYGCWTDDSCGYIIVNTNKIYPYCPWCGAKKKWYTDEIMKISV